MNISQSNQVVNNLGWNQKNSKYGNLIGKITWFPQLKNYKENGCGR